MIRDAYQRWGQPHEEAGDEAVAAFVLDTFVAASYSLAMTDDPPLRPATTDELVETLAFALRYNGRKRGHDADEIMAKWVAERLVKYLEMHRFVIMKKPPLPPATVVASPNWKPGSD